VVTVEEASAAIEKLSLHFHVFAEYEERRPQTWLEEQFDDPGGGDDPVGVLHIRHYEIWVSFLSSPISLTDEDVNKLQQALPNCRIVR